MLNDIKVFRALKIYQEILKTYNNSQNTLAVMDIVGNQAYKENMDFLDAVLAEASLQFPSYGSFIMEHLYGNWVSPVEVKELEKVKPVVEELTTDQANAWANILRWLETSQPFFVLKGFAGTGKSFLMKKLTGLPKRNFYFSAPTNKATAVLAKFVGEDCKTTYGLLGLRMEAEDDKLVLKVKDLPNNLGSNPILVIDEAGMIPKVLAELIKDICLKKGWRAIFVGDPAQLNPVGEESSIVWTFAPKEWRSFLREVKRFDNQLLKLSIDIRECLKTKNYESPIENNNDENGGVFVLASRKEMLKHLAKLELEEWGDQKVICWRNKTVDLYNEYIRKNLGLEGKYAVGERVLLASPLVSGQTILAHTDEEFKIAHIEDRIFNFPEGSIETYALSLVNFQPRFYVPKDEGQFSRFLNMRASAASKAPAHQRRNLWKSFWEIKNTFQSVRYSYALTSHRIQGSTVKNVYVDQADILANRNEKEAFRCLYVAATRPQVSLFTY